MLLVNLKRLYDLQLSHKVPLESLYQDLINILQSFRNIDDEVSALNVVIVESSISFRLSDNQPLVPIQVIAFLLLNMFLHVSWCLHSFVSSETVPEALLSSLLGKRDALLEQLEYFLHKSHGDVRCKNQLAYRVSILFAKIFVHISVHIFVSLFH